MRRGVRLALSVRYIFFHEITRLLGTHLPLGQYISNAKVVL